MKKLQKANNAIEAAKKRLIQKAQKNGLWENFGQTEVRHFEDTLGGDAYGDEEERAIARAIDNFDKWAMDYTPFA